MWWREGGRAHGDTVERGGWQGGWVGVEGRVHTLRKGGRGGTRAAPSPPTHTHHTPPPAPPPPPLGLTLPSAPSGWYSI